MPSSNAWTPLFFRDEPQKTGTSVCATTARRSAARIAASGCSGSSR